MPSINEYADVLLLDFTDAAHTKVTDVLKAAYGDDWLSQGVRQHFKSSQFARVESMLQNPMRVVDMDKAAEELHGLEHFWQIINGNWQFFRQTFGDKQRTQVYLGEISELRHNLAHRRKRHVLLRGDLIRIAGNCKIILSALGAREAETFSDIVDSLSSGGVPWGGVLEGRLPPSDEIYDEFVGRPAELSGLSDWLGSDSAQILVWGYGGAGKSAIAHKFARDVRDGSNERLIAVCWVSAKRTEYVEGIVRERPADFHDMEDLVRAVWCALYGDDEVPADLRSSTLIGHLREMPILLVVDDFDTVSENEELSAFLLHDLRNTPTRVIYTSRQRVPGMKNLEVPPFSDHELTEFVRLRSSEYGADSVSSVQNTDAIRRVTGGYPLFVDDLIHHAALVGVDSALRDWSQKKGDAAREYALRRQVEYLGSSCGDVLIALAAANRALVPVEISSIAGLTDADSVAGLRALLQWRMVNQVTTDESASPAYRMNENTSRLVQQTFRQDNRLTSYSAAFKSLTGERVPEAKKRAIGHIIYRAKEIEANGGFEAAEEHLKASMVGELSDSPDLYGVLGWLYSRQPYPECRQLARAAFDRSHRLGPSKEDPYFHWFTMEKNIAESIITNAIEEGISEDLIAEQWKECERIAQVGMERCGRSQRLCYWAGYAASREAGSRIRAKNFAYAQGAFARSRDWFIASLEAPVSDSGRVNKGQIYRGLTLAFDGLDDETRMRNTLADWRGLSGSDGYFVEQYERLIRKYPSLQSDSRFAGVLDPNNF